MNDRKLVMRSKNKSTDLDIGEDEVKVLKKKEEAIKQKEQRANDDGPS